MHILDRLNAVVDYVECHITDEIDLNHLASIAHCSVYNFQRMFAFITDVSIAEYIRHRRLTLAAVALQQGEMRIVDLALQYGYDSPVSFARAFQTLHGITPSEARKKNTTLKAFPRMTFQIAIKGVKEMNYRIVETESFQVFGLEGVVSLISTAEGIAMPSVWQFWDANFANGNYDRLFKDAGEARPLLYDTMFVRNDMCRIHGLINYKQIDAVNHGYMQFSFAAPESKMDGYTIVEIPSTTWAVFPSDPEDERDPGEIWPELYRRFYREWLPSSKYEKANSPELELYGVARRRFAMNCGCRLSERHSGYVF